jgi:hypothetical protein
MYPVTGARPDLSFVISSLAQFFSAPNKQHVAALKRYLQISKEHGTLLCNFLTVVRYLFLDSVIPTMVTVLIVDNLFWVICLDSEI